MFTVFGGRILVTAFGRERRRAQTLSKTRGIGSGLTAELGEVEIRAGLVPDIHALSELALAPESIKDDGVDGNGDCLDHDFDDAADECPILHAADKGIANIVLEQFAPFIVFAAPAPYILPIAVVSATVQDCSTDSPHDDAESEEEDCKDGVIDGGFLGAFVTSSPVGVEDADGENKRNTGDGQQHDLWPRLGVGGPGW